MQWYYANEGQRSGPVSGEEFAQLVESGVIRAETLVWRAGMVAWLPYAEMGPPPLAQAIPGVPAAAVPAEGAAIPAAFGGENHVLIKGYGGFWLRFLAKIIDGFITGAISWIIMIPIFAVMGAGMASSFDAASGQISPEQMGAFIMLQLISVGVGTVITLCYSIFFIRKYSGTPGKLALGMRVYRADSSRLSVGRIVGRHFAEWVTNFTLCIGYIIAGFDSEKRALHDHIAGTRVVILQK